MQRTSFALNDRNLATASNDCKWPILLKNSKMHWLHFLAKLNRDRWFAL